MSTVRLKKILQFVAAVATFFCASVDLLYGPSRLEYPAPFYILHLSSLVDSLILAATFYCAIGLVRGRRIAWRLSIVVLACAAAWFSIESAHLFSFLSLFPLVTIGLLFVTRSYYRLPVGRALRSGNFLSTLGIVSSITTLIVIARLLFALLEHDLVHPLALTTATVEHMYDFSYLFKPLLLHHYPLYVLLMLIGVVNYSLLAYALLQPISDYYIHSPQAERQVLDLLEAYGNSSEDYFKFFPHDKSYFFSDRVEGFIAYAVENGVCVALADPIAPTKQARRQLLTEFQQYCAKVGWVVAFLGVTNPERDIYEESDFAFVKIGESAVIDLSAQLPSKARKNLRNVINRFQATGYQARFLHTLSAQTLRELQTVSDGWKSQRGRREYRFAMGYFNETYLKACRIFAVFDKHQQMMAFVNLQPNFSRAGRSSIDMIRISPQAPPNTIDFLLQSLRQQLVKEGWHELDLGLAPLSGLGKPEAFGERGLHAIYTMANHWYSFQGLRRFKQKFNPNWQPMYIAYQGSPTNLVVIARALNQLLQFKD